MSKVSVLMPVYNTNEAYLRASIESVLNQSYNDIEILIINDGSTNNCKAVISSYKDERIKYLETDQNCGLVVTLNKGLDAATGDYVCRMDSDDISDEFRFEKQVEFLKNNPDIGVVGTDCAKFPKVQTLHYLTEPTAIKNSFLFEGCAICSASAMMRKSVLDRNNLRYETQFTVAEDYAFWLNLIDFASFSNIPEILYHYRWHEDNISKSNTFLQSLNAQYVMFRAQGKFFNVDSSIVLSTIEKLKKMEKITSDDLETFEAFVFSIKLKMLENAIDCEYNLNRNFYKIALKNCKKDFKYLSILWSSNLNKIAQVRNWTKIENTLRLF